MNIFLNKYFGFSLPASKTVIAKCLKLTCHVFLLSLTSPLFLTWYKYFQNFHKNGRQRYFRENGPFFIFNFHYFQFSIVWPVINFTIELNAGPIFHSGEQAAVSLQARQSYCSCYQSTDLENFNRISFQGVDFREGNVCYCCRVKTKSN